MRMRELILCPAFSLANYLGENTFEVAVVSWFAVAALVIIMIYLWHNFDKRVHQLNYTDAVTGQPNYANFRMKASHLLSKNGGEKYALIYINFQDFKFLNDNFGHVVGDKLLKCLNTTIINHCATGEQVARVSSDQFAYLAKARTSEAVDKRMKFIYEGFKEAGFSSEILRNIILRTGVYYLFDDDNIDTATDNALYAMNSLPSVRKNSIAYFDGNMQQKLLWEQQLEKDKDSGLADEQFALYVQPKYDIETGEICGGEALCRWNHPSKGLLQPGQFIPYFERTGFVAKVDLQIFEKLVSGTKKLLDQGVEPKIVSCNYSRRQLEDKDSPEKYARILQKYGVSPSYFEIELTEEGAISNMETVQYHAKRLKEIGFRMALDDFGSGYSSIQLLYQLPVDVVKFDKSIIDEITNIPLEKDIYQSLINITKKYDMKVIWEGVEHQSQVDYIAELGGRYIQGYLFGKPMTYEQFVRAVYHV